MTSNPDDKDKLKALETELAETWYRLDRYGNSADQEKLQRIRDMMKSFPPEVLQEEALPHFILAVEHYIMERAFQFLPEVAALWEHVKRLTNVANSTPVDKQVLDPLLYWYGELRIRKMKDEGLQRAIQQAEKLESYRNMQGKGSQQGVFDSANKRLPIDYQTRLQNMVINFLGVNAPQTRLETFLRDLPEWRKNPQQILNPSDEMASALLKYPLYILHDGAGVSGYSPDELKQLTRLTDYHDLLNVHPSGLKALARTVYLKLAERRGDNVMPPALMQKLFKAPQSILRHIAALEKLGYSQEQIEQLIREANNVKEY